ncbi:MAG: prolyl oligopeptidase family serine peptidase [Bacteroidota bacterium]
MKYLVEHSPCAPPNVAPVESTIETPPFSILLCTPSHFFCFFALAVLCFGSSCEGELLERFTESPVNVPSFDTIALTYPTTLRDESIADTYFGYPVVDSYRWLESDTTTKVRSWAADQQRLSNNYLQEVPFRAAIAERLQALGSFRKSGLPSFQGSHYYYRYNNGSWAENVLVRARSLKDSITIVLNPNTWSAGGDYTLGRYAFSEDGRYLAYEQQAKDGYSSVIRIVDLQEQTALPDKLEVRGLTSLDWYGDGFYYTSFPTGSPTEPQLFHQLFFHRLGATQVRDELVFADYRTPDRRIIAFADTASQCLVLEVRGNGYGNAVYFRPLNSEDPSFTPIVESLDDRFEWAGGTKDHLYFVTDYEAKQGRLLKVSIAQPGSGYWEDHIAGGADDMLAGWRRGNHWVIQYLRDAAHNVVLYDSLGEQVRRIHLPERGSFTGLSTGKSQQELYFGVSSFLRPETVYRLDLDRYRSALVFSAEPSLKAEEYQLSLKWAPSYDDDTSLPVFLLHQNNLDLTKPHPTLLLAAGPTGDPLVPEWNLSGHLLIPAAIEQGMIVAVANIRGSSGFGRSWKQAGLLRQQQTRLDDLQALAEYLLSQPFVAREKLAVYGAGQAGTLVAATLNQRPDLFAVAIAENGWYDLLRYQNFRGSVPQLPVFGTSQDSLQTNHLLSYSPIHNTLPNKFPASLLLYDPATSVGVPLHSRKLAAELQYQQRGPAPILLYRADEDQPDKHPLGVAALSFLFYQTQTLWK